MKPTYLIPGWVWFIEAGQLHFGNQQVRRADLASFQPVSDFWGRDSHRVYCAGSEMRDADPKTFTVLNRLYAKDSRHAYTVEGVIEDADVESFNAVGPHNHPFNTYNGYARDRHRVYHTVSAGKASVLKDADPATFTACGNGFGMDASTVYFQRKKLAGAKPGEWRHVRGPHSRSGKNAYCLEKKIRGADGRHLVSLPILGTGDFWSRDDKGYYRFDQPADPKLYFEEFRKCCIVVGLAVHAALTWKQTYSFPPERYESWELAGHVWITVTCKGILQKSEFLFEYSLEEGKDVRLGEGFHLNLLYPTAWMEEDRIWIFRPVQDQSRPERPVFFRPSQVWWEYSSMSDLEFIKNLIAEANAR